MQQPSSICPTYARASNEHMPQAMPHDAPRNAQTDRQTYKQPLALGENLTLGNARTRVARFLPPRPEDTPPADAPRSLIDVIRPRTKQRFPVHRTRHTEQRAPIDREDRVVVYARDHFHCVWCGSPNRLTLDHVIPWSAGGTDHIDNLRTLCWDCNEFRSNFAHPADLIWSPPPIGWACLNCCDIDEFPGPVAVMFCYWCREKALGWPERQVAA